MGRGVRSRKPRVEGECVIPPPLPPEVLREYVLNDPEHEARSVAKYIELEADERVIHLEKVTTEYVFNGRYDAWDVHTDKGRWWAITNPTNLYPQDTFKSLDFTLTVHIGLMTRVAARQYGATDSEQEHRLTAAWRRQTEAREALERADEAEDFQAVGMRCRECLLELARAIAAPTMVPAGQEAPQVANFLRWSELIAAALCSGPHAKDIRTYLKSTAASAWHLANWLTHSTGAARFDAEITLDAVGAVVNAFGMAVVRFERGAPDRCPSCSSYRLTKDYRPDLDLEPPYVTLCEACGWVDLRSEHTPTGVTVTEMVST